jgi:hypothetical protein
MALKRSSVRFRLAPPSNLIKPHGLLPTFLNRKSVP